MPDLQPRCAGCRTGEAGAKVGPNHLLLWQLLLKGAAHDLILPALPRSAGRDGHFPLNTLNTLAT